MTTYIVKGLVLPERAQLSIGPIKLRFVYPHDGTQHEMEVNIVLNQITALVHTGKEWSLLDLRNVIAQLILDLVNIIAYIRGYGYEVEIRQVLNPEKGIDYVFGIEVPCIEERNKALNVANEFSRILSKTQGSDGRFISRALHDLSEALKNPADTAFHCFRALETLKQLCGYRYEIEKEGDQWKKLSNMTGHTKEDIENLRRLAFGARHGLPEPLSDEDRVKLFLQTWDIVDSFFEKYVPREEVP